LRIFYTDVFVLPLPEGHRFPMEKYRRLREAVERESLGERIVPGALDDDALRLAHPG